MTVIDPLRVNPSAQVQKLRVTARDDGLVGSHIWWEQPVSFVSLFGLVIGELTGYRSEVKEDRNPDEDKR
ncbi:hypothetical protein SLA2020_273630 [Shorea laevis]